MDFFKKLFPKQLAAQVENSTADSLALYGELSGEGNFVFSPYSLVTAISMAYEGAKGKTREEIAEFFGLEFFEAQQKPQERNDENLRLQIANAIFPDIRFAILPSYSRTLKQSYSVECHLVDYANDKKGSRKTINEWVEEKTDKNIKNLVGEADITPDTSLIIVNAVYFNCEWENKFDAEDTFDGDFYSYEKTVKCPLMNKLTNYAYFEDKEFQVVEIPYKEGLFSMLVFLPREGSKLRDFEKKISFDLIQKAIRAMKVEKVNLSLPKFKQESSMRMSGKLKALGVRSMFTYGDADFSGIDGTKELFIGEIIQKAFIEVAEEGTKAAAATALVARCGSAMTKPPKRFNANRPFFYAIMDKNTSTVLFAGKVVNPKDEN